MYRFRLVLYFLNSFIMFYEIKNYISLYCSLILLFNFLSHLKSCVFISTNTMRLQKTGPNPFKNSAIQIKKIISKKALQMFGQGEWDQYIQNLQLLYDKNSIVQKIKINGQWLVKKIVQIKSNSSQQKKQKTKLMKNQKQIMQKLLKNPQQYLVQPYRVEQKNDEQLILYMEYLPQESLKNYVQSKQYKQFKLSNRQQFEKRNSFIMLQILLAIHKLHSLEFVHRDLKPDNIFIDQSLNIKLGDFGSAQYLLQDDYHLVGTFGYVSPQMVFDTHRLSVVFGRSEVEKNKYEQSDYMKIDMWSLGVIFYQLFHNEGAMPYKLKQLGQKCNYDFMHTYKQQLFKIPYQQIFSQPNQCQKWIQNLIKSMLIKNQHDRPSWEEIYLRNLQNFLNLIQKFNFLDKDKKKKMKLDFIQAKTFYQQKCDKIKEKRQKQNEFQNIYNIYYNEMSQNIKFLLKSKSKAKNVKERQKILDYLHQFHACLNKLIQINQSLQEGKHQISHIYQDLYKIKYIYEANTGTKIQKRAKSFRKYEVMNKSVQELNKQVKEEKQKELKK